MKKESLKIDHLLGFACSAKKKSNEGGLAGLQCQEAQDQAKRPNDKGRAAAVVVDRPGVRSRMMRYSEKEQAMCVWEGQRALESEHSISRDQESR